MRLVLFLTLAAPVFSGEIRPAVSPAAIASTASLQTQVNQLSASTSAIQTTVDQLNNSTQTFVLRAGDTMTGPLVVQSTVTVNGIQFASGGFFNIGGQNSLMMPTTFSSSATFNSSVIVPNGNLGVGTVAPAFALEVTTPTGAHFSTATTAGTGLYVASNGNVGIGVAAPASWLAVSRSTSNSGLALPYAAGVAGQLGSFLTNSDPGTTPTACIGVSAGPTNAALSAFCTRRVTAGYGTILLQNRGPGGATDVNSVLAITSAGYVGIGLNNTAPTSQFEVGSAGAFNVKVGGNVGIGVISPAAQIEVRSSASPAGSVLQVSSGNAASMLTVTGAGNVGIGQAAPIAALDVQGSQAQKWITVTSTYTVLATDYGISCTTTTAFTVTLPSTTSIAGKIYHVDNAGSGIITIVSANGELVGKHASYILSIQRESILVRADSNGGWLVTGGKNLAALPYANLITTQTLTVASSTQEYRATFSPADSLLVGVAYANGTITLDEYGLYRFDFSGLADSSGGGAVKLNIYMKVNGSIVANSRTQVQVGASEQNTVAFPFFHEVTTLPTTVEFWYNADGTNAQWLYLPAVALNPGTTPAMPAMPSIILGVQKVSR